MVRGRRHGSIASRIVELHILTGSCLITLKFTSKLVTQICWLGMIGLLVGLCIDCAAEGPVATPPTDYPKDDDSRSCVDKDKDGFGSDCRLGPDCDDNDAERNISCGAQEVCEPGTTGPCYELRSVTVDALHCVAGTRTCSNGLWGSCSTDKEFSLPLPDAYAGIITGPIECNPCNPACALSTDYPTDIDLTPDNSDNLFYDPDAGGITIGDSGSSGTILPDGDGDGVPDAYDSCPANPACDGWGDDPITCAACADLGDIFHELPFGGPTQYDPLIVETRLRSADIYFLMDNTASMAGEISNLQTSLTTGNFLIHPENCGLRGGNLVSWTAQYYPNATLSGAPILTQTEYDIAHDWGITAPEGLGINDDEPFSVRWTGTFDAEGGDYTISATHDDGMRVFIDGDPYLATGWGNGTERVSSTTVNLSAGNHTILVEYFENTGKALAYFSILKGLAVDLPAQYRGVIGAIRCEIDDAQFGVGYHDDYPYDTPEANGENCPAKTYDNTPRGRDKPYGNFQSITSNTAAITTAVGKYQAACGADDPESQVMALYAVASGNGIADSRGTLNFGAMTTITPAVIDLSATPVNVTGTAPFADTYATAHDVGVIGEGPAKRFTGNSTAQAHNYALNGSGSCDGTNNRDVVFKFTVTEPRTVAISTTGTAFTDIIHLLDSAQAIITCDSGSAGVAGDSLITRRLDPGTYYVVLDGFNAASGREGVYNIAFGSRLEETIGSPSHIANATAGWQTFDSTTVGLNDDMNDSGCAPEGTLPARDAFYSFDVNVRTEMGIIADKARNFNNTNDNNRIALLLYDSGYNLLACSERRGNEAAFITELDPGRYYVRVDSRDENDRGAYRFSIGPWKTIPMGAGADRWFVPPQSSCPAGTWGYPCFRDEAIPVVILMTDNRFHDGPSRADVHDEYSYFATDYYSMLHVVNRQGIKVIGIHSGTAPTEVCEVPCLSGHYEEVCENQPVCDAPTCGDKQVCAQGKCWTIRKCNLCPGNSYHNEWVCEDEFVCDAYGTDEACYEDYPISGEHLQVVAGDTGAIDSQGRKMVYQINSDGTGISTSVVRAVNEVAQGSRMNITLRINDNPATPAVDERLFVKSIFALPTAETNARCLSPQPGDWFYGCLPGTNATFSVGFGNTIVAPTAVPQVFDFTMDTLGDGTFLLGTTTVRIVVPPTSTSLEPSGTYWRNYDSTDACLGTERPWWGDLSWTASFPAGTSIRWEIRTANTEPALAAATPVTFIAPATSSPVNIGTKLTEAGQGNSLPFVRVTAVLLANAGLTAAPVLSGFELEYDCRVAE